jgi:alpha/beta superfamily hydrolase
MSSKCHNLELMIPCSIGHLEGRFYYMEELSKDRGMVICPPHPLLAGNINNNVVQAIASKVCSHMPVLLFNYRAVGKSTHPQPDLPLFEYWESMDSQKKFQEIIEDTAAVLAWSQKLFQSIHLVGYSFGAYVALEAAIENVCSLTVIAPPLAEHNFSRLNDFSKSIFSVLAANDTLLGNGFPSHCLTSQLIVQGADHFFLGKENEVANIVLQNINKGLKKLNK